MGDLSWMRHVRDKRYVMKDKIEAIAELQKLELHMGGLSRMRHRF